MSARLSVNLNDETEAALRALAKKEGVSITEEVRRAVSVYKFIYDEVTSGKKLQLTDKDEIVTLKLIWQEGS